MKNQLFRIFKPRTQKLLLNLCSIFFLLFISAKLYAENSFSYNADQIDFGRQIFQADTDQSGLVFATDLNADGASDIVITGATFPNRFSESRGAQAGLILLNNGDNTFTPAGGDVPQSEHAREIISKDFNGDGKLDIFISDHGYDAAPFSGFKNQLLLATSSGFMDVSNRLPDIKDFSHNVAAGDIDSDGDIDLFVANLDTIESKLSYFLINDGQANFTLNRSRLPSSLVSPDSNVLAVTATAELADLDNDGAVDLIVGIEEAGHPVGKRPSTIYWNDGNGSFSETRKSILEKTGLIASAPGITAIEIKAFDVDEDNDLDIILSAYDINFQGRYIQLFINQGKRNFQDETLSRLGSESQNADTSLQTPYVFNFFDLNGDGIKDIIANSPDLSVSNIIIFEGQRDGRYQSILAENISDDPEISKRLSALPLLSNQEFGYAEVFSFLENNEKVFGINYVPLTIESLEPANFFDPISNLLKVKLDAGSAGTYSLDFSITQASPQIQIKAELDSLRMITHNVEQIATVDLLTGILAIPEVKINGKTEFQNVILERTDTANFLFNLTSFQ